MSAWGALRRTELLQSLQSQSTRYAHTYLVVLSCTVACMPEGAEGNLLLIATSAQACSACMWFPTHNFSNMLWGSTLRLPPAHAQEKAYAGVCMG